LSETACVNEVCTHYFANMDMWSREMTLGICGEFFVVQKRFKSALIDQIQ
jgi:hypothetical protein